MEEKYYMVIDPDTGVFYFTQEETNAYMDYTTMEHFCEDNRKRNLKIDPDKYNPGTALCITLDNYVEYIIEYDIPTPPSETELLKDQVEMLDGALNEVLFTILPEIQGGEI